MHCLFCKQHPEVLGAGYWAKWRHLERGVLLSSGGAGQAQV